MDQSDSLGYVVVESCQQPLVRDRNGISLKHFPVGSRHLGSLRSLHRVGYERIASDNRENETSYAVLARADDDGVRRADAANRRNANLVEVWAYLPEENVPWLEEILSASSLCRPTPGLNGHRALRQVLQPEVRCVGVNRRGIDAPSNLVREVPKLCPSPTGWKRGTFNFLSGVVAVTELARYFAKRNAVFDTTVLPRRPFRPKALS
jgi:hypothetical protein